MDLVARFTEILVTQDMGDAMIKVTEVGYSVYGLLLSLVNTIQLLEACRQVRIVFKRNTSELPEFHLLFVMIK